MLDRYWIDRGSPWEYDPGPPGNRSWARLFAETPNYRGIGKAVIGREAAGDATVPIAHVYQFDQIVDGHHDMERGTYAGKLVVLMSPID